MTVKQATEIAAKLEQGLNNTQLEALFANGVGYTEKEINTIVNAYRQRNAEDLAGPAAPKAVKKTAIKAKTKPVKKMKAKVVTKKSGVGARQIALILTGLSNADVLAKILKEFRGVKTTVACVAWYRAQMRKSPKKYGVAKASLVPASTPAK